MIAIRYAAPFGVFRDFSAGYFRSSFRFASYSALYGLVLNVMGIEMRGPLGADTTEVKDELPRFAIASAVAQGETSRHSFCSSTDDGPQLPESAVLFQQLHALPVGSTNKHRIPLTKGAKHHISPGRREVLMGIRGLCVVKGGEDFEDRLHQALTDPPRALEGGQPRYGVPFLGDNSFMLEELEETRLDERPVEWLVENEESVETDTDFFTSLFEAQGSEALKSVPFRLTIWADRQGMLQTRSGFFRCQSGVLSAPPDNAWVEVGPTM